MTAQTQDSSSLAVGTPSQRLSVIVGLGKTGLACARYFARQGLPFAVQDSNPSPANLAQLQAIAPLVVCSPLEAGALCAAAQVVLSPGVPLATHEVQRAIMAGVKVTGDINIFLQLADKPVIGITGSNGKSTVTTMVGELLAASGLAVGVGGNIGTPCLDLLGKGSEIYVLELSSYQLEVVEMAACEIAVVLNLSPDHLDRYPSVNAYYGAKERVYKGARMALVSRQLPVELHTDRVSKVISFGDDAPLTSDSYGLRAEGARLFLARGATNLLAVDQLRLKGRHNAMNALVALAIGELLGIDLAVIRQTLQAFPGLPHRCEVVGTFAGAEFINDSKATNPGATRAAIEGLAESGRPLVLILGGVGKGADFQQLQAVIRQHVTRVYLYGADAAVINRAIAGCVGITRMNNLAEVITSLALELQKLPRAMVLFAPACASFDQYQNFEHRGQEFKRLVLEAFP
ncbi:MAG: UDP-N-acetylmuramoyl-L-alanine--D-glutamate ligase [Pseudomonadales bacterium]|jgi:UDP-N-acetylmuramoylalanine--D-glutamate ligase|nr:UDP-N-acetylmuramoyl-L-alanine--D-glutamate ligase [Pseudomonadales bacterium]MDP4640657.1 UDP-N-acetylmuramoyl-L-alanine--D-glutamate ligase [Pseudomonadales bacterium]MDP4765712.1 UDP-N-acetylmuramoyl-L-alanine--D-glutamate ligase [Pseudomonadales bacterium]MDP4912424.1 UDP-N-acetylmuramoyl-L-alanine--D-glutamate ligase [Pseudomonadales bacterium]MDP5059319.1 UDP-N-acetylmuramoyl-L-alanine--D-glutamate ligase [Pseudomonadales bacterium]